MSIEVSKESNTYAPQGWILLSPGTRALSREPLDVLPDDCSLATPSDLLAANLGRPFPWGSMADMSDATLLWRRHRIGFGGLIFKKWFVTTEGRFGGAENVPTEEPGTLRRNLLCDGGKAADGILAPNEGCAVTRAVDPLNADMYRKVQMHAVRHVAADGGAIIVSPITTGNKVYVGFVGRCMSCPNPEIISLQQLRKAVPEYDFELFDEWKNWSLTESHAA